MTSFRTEIVGLTPRDQVMLRALLGAIPAFTGLAWSPLDRESRSVHFVDVDSPVGHRYWRGLTEAQRRDDSIALAYSLPTQIDAQARWLTKPIRSRALTDALLLMLHSPDRDVAPVVIDAPAPTLLRRLVGLRKAAR